MGDKNSDRGRKAIDQIDDLRKEYLQKRGYMIESGRATFGPYFMAKLKT